MEEILFDALMEENMEVVCQEMIRPQLSFTGGSKSYDVNLNKYALDKENFLVAIDVWMNNILEFDENSKMFNRFLKKAHLDNEDLLDYNVPDYFEDYGILVDVMHIGYTYNDRDCCRLDRDIHYTVFKYDGEYYTVFRVHHGADARVGFGDLACFKIREIDYFFISMEISAYIQETDEDIEWYEVEDVATYDKEKEVWIHNEAGYEIILYTNADGF